MCEESQCVLGIKLIMYIHTRIIVVWYWYGAGIIVVWYWYGVLESLWFDTDTVHDVLESTSLQI